MTEEALQTPLNTLNSSRNFVFENGEQTGGFRSGYHKGAFTTGQHKEILRLLPYRCNACFGFKLKNQTRLRSLEINNPKPLSNYYSKRMLF